MYSKKHDKLLSYLAFAGIASLVLLLVAIGAHSISTNSGIKLGEYLSMVSLPLIVSLIVTAIGVVYKIFRKTDEKPVGTSAGLVDDYLKINGTAELDQQRAGLVKKALKQRDIADISACMLAFVCFVLAINFTLFISEYSLEFVGFNIFGSWLISTALAVLGLYIFSVRADYSDRRSEYALSVIRSEDGISMFAKKKKVRENTFFNVINVALLVIISAVCFLPFLNVISVALSTAGLDINFSPRGFTWFNFQHVFSDEGFWRALCVSLFVVVVGTVLSVIVMFSAAYALSKPDFPCRRGIMVFFIITMIFSGGMVPNYIVVRELGLTGSPWALILPSVVQVYNLILIKSYLEGLPKELEESAGIDGANSLQIMFRVLLPVSMPCVASVSLFTAVTFWNNYTSALLYLGTEEKWYPLSLYILNYIQSGADVLDVSKEAIQHANIESAMIVVSIIPILLVYPFVLKYFTKGVTVGAVKG